MTDYEADARIEKVVRALADLQAGVEEMSAGIERSIEWATSEITSSIGDLTEAVQVLTEILTPSPRPTLLDYVRSAGLRITRKWKPT